MAIRKNFDDAPEPVDPARRLDQGDLGDRYRLRGRLRRRSGAPVLLAVDEADGRLVAIKAAANAEAATAEADVLGHLDHPGVVRLRERLEIDGEHWLVLDYVPGDSLEARLRASGPMSPDAVQGLLRDLAGTLDHIHAQGYLHRDLKPANVLLDEAGQPVLIDFGAALAADQPAPADGASELSDGYAAPEQYLDGEAEGPWIDLYALAALGYRALGGEVPPAATDRLDHGAELDLTRLDGPPTLLQALERGLALDPRERPQTAADFVALLERAPAPAPPVANDPDDEGLPTVRIRRRPGRRAVAVEQPSAPMSPPRRRRLVPLLVILALVLIGVAGAYAARPLYDRHVKTTWLVDPGGDGDVASISEALTRAGEGARVVVRPGTYEESLVLDRAAQLVAEEGAERPVIAPPAGPCLLTTASGGSLAGFDLQGSETAGVACLAISGGDLRVQDSRITASAGPAIEVRAGATPEIRGGEVRGVGVVIREGSQPVVQDVTFEGVEGPSIIVRS
ncbi:MAG: serine/threonine-protein kinase, partial [Geminicoccaceae bacterium]|nr:serine/threonine-protein kinase [Geminicoccaceae bacterium]